MGPGSERHAPIRAIRFCRVRTTTEEGQEPLQALDQFIEGNDVNALQVLPVQLEPLQFAIFLRAQADNDNARYRVSAIARAVKIPADDRKASQQLRTLRHYLGNRAGQFDRGRGHAPVLLAQQWNPGTLDLY